jgi:hypothetical protein
MEKVEQSPILDLAFWSRVRSSVEGVLDWRGEETKVQCPQCGDKFNLLKMVTLEAVLKSERHLNQTRVRINCPACRRFLWAGISINCSVDLEAEIPFWWDERPDLDEEEKDRSRRGCGNWLWSTREEEWSCSQEGWDSANAAMQEGLSELGADGWSPDRPKPALDQDSQLDLFDPVLYGLPPDWESDVFYVGRKQAPTPPWDLAKKHLPDWLEQLTDGEEDYSFDFSEWPDFQGKPGILSGLENKMCDAIRSWCEAHGQVPSWFVIRDVSTHHVYRKKVQGCPEP